MLPLLHPLASTRHGCSPLGRSPHLPGPRKALKLILVPQADAGDLLRYSASAGFPSSQLCVLSHEQPHLLLLAEYTHSHYFCNSWQ